MTNESKNSSTAAITVDGKKPSVFISIPRIDVLALLSMTAGMLIMLLQSGIVWTMIAMVMFVFSTTMSIMGTINHKKRPDRKTVIIDDKKIIPSTDSVSSAFYGFLSALMVVACLVILM